MGQGFLKCKNKWKGAGKALWLNLTCTFKNMITNMVAILLTGTVEVMCPTTYYSCILIMFVSGIEYIYKTFLFSQIFYECICLSRTGTVERQGIRLQVKCTSVQRINTESCLSMCRINLVEAVQILMVKLCVSVSIFIYFNLFIKQKYSNYKCHKSQSNWKTVGSPVYNT